VLEVDMKVQKMRIIYYDGGAGSRYESAWRITFTINTPQYVITSVNTTSDQYINYLIKA